MEKKNQQRKWVREEVVILVTEYFKNKNSPNDAIEKSYHDMSEFLKKREELVTGKPVPDIFRNYAGIRMQTGRIRCLDPKTKLEGMHGTKLQKEVVKEFLNNPEALYNEAEGIYKKYLHG